MKVQIVVSGDKKEDIETYLNNQKFITESSEVIETRRGRYAASATVEAEEDQLINETGIKEWD